MQTGSDWNDRLPASFHVSAASFQRAAAPGAVHAHKIVAGEIVARNLATISGTGTSDRRHPVHIDFRPKRGLIRTTNLPPRGRMIAFTGQMECARKSAGRNTRLWGLE